MNNILMLAIVTFLLSFILIIITLAIIKKKESNKYKKEIEKLDIEKNEVIGVPILSEMSKVKELVKTDDLKNKLDNWNTTFTSIKDEKISRITDLITEADYLIEKKDYKEAVKKIADVELEINSLRKKTYNLLEEIKVVTTSEERNRNFITKLKIVYRETKDKFERTIKDYNVVATSISKELDSIDRDFTDFENCMENNDYLNVEKKIIILDKRIKDIKKIIDDAPSIILTATSLIPNKIEEIITLYYRMLRDGYPLDYLNVEYNVKEIKNKIAIIMDRLEKLEMDDYDIELKTMLDYFNTLYINFDKEKECKDVFKETVKSFEKKVEKINKIFRDIYVQIDDIKNTYDLNDEEINKFSLLNKKLEKLNEDFGILVEYSKNKTFAYSKLVEEMNGLNLKLSRLQDDLDYRLRSITSMQDDEFRAKEQLNQIQSLLKKSKNKLKEYKIPVIPNSYFVELKEAQEAIREIIRELDRKPIAIKVLNIRVDTARDLVFKIYNKTNDMVRSVILSEKIIVYGNRFRSINSEINVELDKAEDLFFKGYYKKSYDISVNILKKYDIEVIEKI